ncbi:MAG TPA: hypothetical protein VGG76_07200 [Gemmatimonadaceae bacterium]
MTDSGGGGTEAQAFREIMRRAGHEIRNALSGAAVNSEVVRSRSQRDGSARELAAFAERAAAQVSEASSLSDGLLALVGSVVASQSEGSLKAVGAHGGAKRIELMLYGDSSTAIASDIERLTSRIGVTVEQDGQRVILTILPEGKSHSKD